ncbi:hypothetical protein BDU57DRAFT_424976, partial [Ampelomyces quisqualis]
NNNNTDSKTYRQQVGEYYNQKYSTWMPWIEDKYLSWFTKDNKASYATKQNLDKSKITNIPQVDNLQDTTNSLVSAQLAPNGLAQPLGDSLSKQAINRAERGGKDEDGNALAKQAPLSGYAQSAASGVVGAAKGAGGYVGGVVGG